MGERLTNLTPPQYFLLVDLDHGPKNVATYYPPAKALVTAGLAEWKAIRYSDQLHITDAGRSLLKENPNG